MGSSKSSWVFTQIHLEELKLLANGAVRKGKPSPMGGSAIAVYINLRGRCYKSKVGDARYYCWCSQLGIAQDLNWDIVNGPKNRVSDAIRDLKDAGFIKVWPKEDRTAEALRLRKWLKCGRTTSLYEVTMFKDLRSGSNRSMDMNEQEEGHVQTGGQSCSNMDKEEEPNNKKKEDLYLNNKEDLNITSIIELEDEEMFPEVVYPEEDVREYIKQFQDVEDLEILIRMNHQEEEIISALRIMKSRSILEQRVLDLLSRQS